MAPLLSRASQSFGFGRKKVSGGGGISVTGGDVANALDPGNGYLYHTFASSGALVVESGTITAQVLVVAGGGGGGGGYYTGGAGAGGVVYGSSIPLSPGTYPIVVGSGGAGAPFATLAGNGGPSQFNSVTAIGGGGGGSGPPGPVGSAGGSSGGSGYYSGPPGGLTPQPVPVSYTAYGNNSTPWDPGIGNGGGGAGGGRPGPPSRKAGPGQPFSGFEYPVVGLTTVSAIAQSPTDNHYGGGGSGGMPGSDVPGGAGGGGTGVGAGGGSPTTTPPATRGVDKLGGGGGGVGNPRGAGGRGGDGVVIVRYLK